MQQKPIFAAVLQLDNLVHIYHHPHNLCTKIAAVDLLKNPSKSGIKNQMYIQTIQTVLSFKIISMNFSSSLNRTKDDNENVVDYVSVVVVDVESHVTVEQWPGPENQAEWLVQPSSASQLMSPALSAHGTTRPAPSSTTPQLPIICRGCTTSTSSSSSSSSCSPICCVPA